MRDRGPGLPEEFLTFLADHPDVDASGPGGLHSTWRAWSTLYAPGAPEPKREAFEEYFRAAELPAALGEWEFTGEIRQSQQVILEAVGDLAVTSSPGPLHIVAPPGAGKTLIGLLLAMRRGHRTLALAPTSTIRHQWARSADRLARGAWDETSPDDAVSSAVSQDPKNLADFTALTYQMLSTVDSTNPFEDLARRRWIDELIEAGRTAADAEGWVTTMEETNRKSFRRGIRRRARAIRRDVVREDPSRLEEALHPNARELIARIAEQGVATIILDECHHLLDHWALVVHCLVNRLRARGVQPLLIGLTATLPSSEDGPAYDNYTRLLGDVDYELPTPAVVKEGNLAPYRSFAWFVTPTAPELDFIRHHEGRLSESIETTFREPPGQDFLTGVLQAGEGPPGRRLAQAFKEDPTIAEAASRMLTAVLPDHPLVRLFPASAAVPADTEAQIRLLARYAMTVLLPDPGSAEKWAQIKAVLVDFGYHLTDRGIRRGRDPIDAILATTAAKDFAVLDVLHLERRTTEQVRAVVVCDFAVHGHQRGVPKGTGELRAGALRCHGLLAAAETVADMRPVLVTARHLRTATRDAGRLARAFGEILGEEVAHAPVDGREHVSELSTTAGSARVLAAVSELMTTGEVSLIVGTRGLLGEGWDCPAVNTLIDLAAVATSASTQQLRGRTLRLDPAWPGKVAHNWAVTTVLEPETDVDATGDLGRLERKLSMVWGLSLGGSDAVIKGTGHTLSPEHAAALARLEAGESGATAAKVNRVCIDTFPTREDTYDRWKVGEPYIGVESATARIETDRPLARPFRSGITFEVCFLAVVSIVAVALSYGLDAFVRSGGSITAAVVTTIAGTCAIAYVGRKEIRRLVQSVKQFALPLAAYEGAALAIAETLARRGETPDFGSSNIHVEAERSGKVITGYVLTIAGGSDAQQAAVLDALEGMFEPISSPRFVLEVGVAELEWKRPISRIAVKVMGWRGYRGRFFGLPRTLGGRREDARFLADRWEEHVGPCVLHEITAPEDMEILTTARRQFGGSGVRVRRRDVWA